MATTSLQLDYDEIRRQVGMLLAYDRSASNWTADQAQDVADCIRNGLRKFYYPPALDRGAAPHRWSFLHPQATLTTTAPYTDGTVEVTDGVVTLSGSTFPSWATNAWFECDGRFYEVASRDGSTQLTLVDTSSDNDQDAGSSYSLLQYVYDLPSDFDSLDGTTKLYYHPDESTTHYPLEYRSWEMIRLLYRNSNYDSILQRPRYFTIYPGQVDTTSVQPWKLAIYPTANDVLHMSYRYNVVLSDLDGTNLYPPGGGAHSQTILEAILSEAELRLGNKDGTHKAEFQRLLMASIEYDRRATAHRTAGVAPSSDPGRYVWDRIPEDEEDYVIPVGLTLADLT